MFSQRLLCMVLGLCLLAACGTNEQEPKSTENEQTNEQKSEQTEEGNFEVDKGLLNVEITVPASMFEGQDIDTVIADAEKEGIKEVTKNEDGSLTYKMSKAQHKEMMADMEKGIEETLEEMKTSEDYVSIKDVTHNNTFSEFTLLVDKEAYENSMDGFAVFGLGMSGTMYQFYNGIDKENSKVTVIVKDQATQEVLDQTVFPDDMEEEEAQ